MEIRTLGDLLRHYPARWVDRREIRSLSSLTHADALPAAGEDERSRKPIHTVLGEVAGSRLAGPPRGRGRRGGSQRVEVRIRDGAGAATLVFFGGSWRRQHFPEGAKVLVSGTVGVFRGALQFQSPEYEILDVEEEAAIHTGRLYPVYPLTKGLTQRSVRGWMRRALDETRG